MLLDNSAAHARSRVPTTIGPISWWSWRPGIRPQSALLIGIPITLIALLLTILGLATLVVGIEDTFTPPLLLPGMVLQRHTAMATSFPQLTIRLHGPANFPQIIALPVSLATYQHVMSNVPVLVSYSPHLHVAYAIEYGGQHYAVAGASAAGNPIGAAALLLLGLLLLPYPALLAHWGWQDLLIERYKQAQRANITAYVMDKRATGKTRIARPGFAGRSARPWYGLALLPCTEKAFIQTFSVNQETYERIQDRAHVNIVYSPHLHYVYIIQKLQD